MTKEKKTKEQDSNTKTNKVDINSVEWNDYVLQLLSDDEKIDGNPTTDGLRRIFEIALDCNVVESISTVVQSPEPNNEKRATVVHTIGYIINGDTIKKTVSGAADVYYGNCDKIYRNHPVAVAETRAEGRALRRGLKLRKVVAAEEVSQNIEDDINQNSVDKISEQQVNFIDALAKRNNINIKELLIGLSVDATNIKNITHNEAVGIIRELSRLQQNIDSMPSNILGYDQQWRVK